MLLNCCYCPYIRTILKYVHHFANIANNYNITTVNANRAINSNGQKRGKVEEVIIRNYGKE